MYDLVKRIIDFIASLLTIIFMFPVLCLVAVVIKCDSKGPVIFKQQRHGRNQKLFTIYKFRTMRTDTPNVSTENLGDPSVYMTKIGEFLRKSSLDELPQLFNILKGDMSIVGPRPALYNQYDLIEMREKVKVNSIRPGLTGYAQVRGRDFITDTEKVEFDRYYFENMNLLFDIQIIWWTVKSVSKLEGVKIN
ncbi:sugar transferase [Jeotgalibacillus marinus]|uniref:Sugar transferase n=1 Tax=Jeotgalibacillus marinus TaxID=86667 RepID=A0ABV3Q0D0_9BACL